MNSRVISDLWRIFGLGNASYWVISIGWTDLWSSKSNDWRKCVCTRCKFSELYISLVCAFSNFPSSLDYVSSPVICNLIRLASSFGLLISNYYVRIDFLSVWSVITLVGLFLGSLVPLRCITSSMASISSPDMREIIHCSTLC